MSEEAFAPPAGAFTRSVTIRFSHCDAAGIVYFPHYFDMFNGVIEDWYKAELKHDYAELVMGSRLGFPFVHIECDFKIPSMMGEIIDLTLLVERIGRYTPEAAYARGVADLAVLARLAPADGYVHGPAPTSIDAGIYGFVANIYFFAIDTPLKRFVVAQPNLVRHCRAIHQMVTKA